MFLTTGRFLVQKLIESHTKSVLSSELGKTEIITKIIKQGSYTQLAPIFILFRRISTPSLESYITRWAGSKLIIYKPSRRVGLLGNIYFVNNKGEFSFPCRCRQCGKSRAFLSSFNFSKQNAMFSMIFRHVRTLIGYCWLKGATGNVMGRLLGQWWNAYYCILTQIALIIRLSYNCRKQSTRV